MRKLHSLKFFFLLAFSLICTGLTAQDSTAIMVVHKDPRVDMLVRKQASINVASKKSTARTGRGYRLMVINTNKRDEALAAKTKVYTYFPDQKAYLSYQTPYFKLKVGNFKTRAEAEAFRRQVAQLFPQGVFILNDIIELKPEREEE